MKHQKDLNKEFWKECFLTEYCMASWAESIAKDRVPITHKGLWFTDWPYVAELFFLAHEILQETK